MFWEVSFQTAVMSCMHFWSGCGHTVHLTPRACRRVCRTVAPALMSTSSTVDRVIVPPLPSTKLRRTGLATAAKARLSGSIVDPLPSSLQMFSESGMQDIVKASSFASLRALRRGHAWWRHGPGIGIARPSQSQAPPNLWRMLYARLHSHTPVALLSRPGLGFTAVCPGRNLWSNFLPSDAEVNFGIPSRAPRGFPFALCRLLDSFFDDRCNRLGKAGYATLSGKAVHALPGPQALGRRAAGIEKKSAVHGNAFVGLCVCVCDCVPDSLPSCLPVGLCLSLSLFLSLYLLAVWRRMGTVSRLQDPLALLPHGT